MKKFPMAITSDSRKNVIRFNATKYQRGVGTVRANISYKTEKKERK